MLVKTWDKSTQHQLLYKYPILWKILHSPWVFDHTLWYIVTPGFILLLAVLFLGSQTRDHNAALTIFWAGWWPGVMLSYPFLGRIWCTICPFMTFGKWAQEAVTKFGGEDFKLKKWPKDVEEVGAPFAFGLFFVILRMWEELWNLPQNATLSAWLLLLITGGAIVGSVQYEKCIWCHHFCPIGAMCKTFATAAIVEVRSFKPNCQGCKDPQCYKGNSPAVEPSDTFAIKGCTMDLKNNQLRDMGHCVMCGACVKNCEREVPELNARPIGLDYGLPWLIPPAFQDPKNMKLSMVETNFWMGALLTLLHGSVLVHYMPKILSIVGVDPLLVTATPALDTPPFMAHSLIAAGILGLPGMLHLATDEISIQLDSARQSQWARKEDPAKRDLVIDIYETIMKSDNSLKETMQEFDPDGDSQILTLECQRALGCLNVSDDEAKTMMDLMKRRVGDGETISIEMWLNNLQQMYLEARQPESRLLESGMGIMLPTQKTFVELFDQMDKDNDGFILKEDLVSLLDRNKIHLTDKDKQSLFTRPDVLETGRLNLFEFMSVMRKIVRVGIQEIGYGYLPLMWAVLTAFWMDTGLKELGLSLARLPDTFYLDHNFVSLPSIAASDEVVHTVQALLVVGAIPPSIGLTQKLCNDNNVGNIRFGLHATLQVVGAYMTLYLMLSPDPLMA